jgi:hypothetical protein
LFQDGRHHLHVHAKVLVDKEIAGGHDLPPGNFRVEALEFLGNAPSRFSKDFQEADEGEGRFFFWGQASEVFVLRDFQSAPASVPHVEEPDTVVKVTPPHG